MKDHNGKKEKRSYEESVDAGIKLLLWIFVPLMGGCLLSLICTLASMP